MSDSAWHQAWQASEWALAAYHAEEGGDVHVWSYKNARGVITVLDGALVIGVAGTNDKADLYQGSNVHARNVAEWGKMAGITTAKDASEVVSTEGFLDYTASCYLGITRALLDIGLDFSKFVTIYLCGHSLGGAAAQLLQMTEAFKESKAFVYGSPKVFKDRTYVPQRIRTHAWKFTDLVTYAPISCKHASAQNLVLTREGHVPRHRIPASKLFAVFFRAVIVWIQGGIHSALAAMGFPSTKGLFTPHSMSGYRNLLQR